MSFIVFGPNILSIAWSTALLPGRMVTRHSVIYVQYSLSFLLGETRRRSVQFIEEMSPFTFCRLIFQRGICFLLPFVVNDD